MQINKNHIDQFFNENHKSLLLAIKKTKLKYMKGCSCWNTEELLSDTYLHLVDSVDKMTEEKHVESFFMRYMTNQIVWSNSKINLLYIDKKTTATEVIDFNLVEDESDLEEKIMLELDYNNKKAILYDFYQQLETKQEQIFFEVVFYKGIKTVKDLSAHFGINRNYIQIMKKKMMDDLKFYINNLD